MLTSTLRRWKQTCAVQMLGLGLFWRFLIVMSLTSILGLLLFVSGGTLLSQNVLTKTLASRELQQTFNSALQIPLPSGNRADPAFCAYALQALSANAALIALFPNGGPNAWLKIVHSDRLTLQYTVGGARVCDYSGTQQQTSTEEKGSGAVADAEWTIFTIPLSAPDQMQETLTLQLQPERGLHLLQTVIKDIPWNMALVFNALINFISALTLAPILVRRIKRAELVARSWTEGNMQARIVDNSSDEFGNLIRSFNHLADSFRDVIKIKQELAASEERNRLARDLHDTAKQRAFSLNLQLTVVKSLGLSNLRESDRLVGSSLALVQNLQNDLASVIKRLTGTTISELGFREMLEQELRSLFGSANMHWQVDVNDAVNTELGDHPNLAQQIFLIALEASANVLRHADAQHIRLTLSAVEHTYTLHISDDGKGFDSAVGDSLGMGLANMRLRAQSLPHGVFSIDSKRDGGTTVSVQFQLGSD